MTCKKQRVKKKKLTRNELLELVSVGKLATNGCFYISQTYHQGQIVLPKTACMQKNPFLARMEEKYNQTLAKIENK